METINIVRSLLTYPYGILTTILRKISKTLPVSEGGPIHLPNSTVALSSIAATTLTEIITRSQMMK